MYLGYNLNVRKKISGTFLSSAGNLDICGPENPKYKGSLKFAELQLFKSKLTFQTL